MEVPKFAEQMKKQPHSTVNRLGKPLKLETFEPIGLDALSTKSFEKGNNDKKNKINKTRN